MAHVEHSTYIAVFIGPVARNVYVWYTIRMAKSRVIPVRLEPGQWETIQRAAEMRGQTASAYLRHAALLAATRDGLAPPITIGDGSPRQRALPLKPRAKR